MKIAAVESDVTVMGASTSSAFSIKNSAKAFSILSSGLYSDKILAIVRELSCNAYDSHVEAGKKDVQFDVHLPNTLEPEFWVRDYGVGLDHAGVTQVYSTYFESTKQNSNDYIGALGLGSKSPFSYTSTFAVTAIKDGIRRRYSAVVDQGIPTIVQFGGDTPTTDPDGVEVKFAVQSMDFYKFSEAARKVFEWFETPPNILGAEIAVRRPLMTHENIILGVDIRDTRNSSNRKPLARQGNVVYPLSPNAGDIQDEYRHLLNIPFVIDFPIGSLDVAASREELSYIDLTNKSINDRLAEVQAGLAVYVDRELAAATTDWERGLVVSKLTDQAFGDIVKSRMPTLMKSVQLVTLTTRPVIQVDPATMTAGNFTLSAYLVKSRSNRDFTCRLSKTNDPTDTVNVPIRPDGVHIFVNDLGKRSCLAHIRTWIQALPDGQRSSSMTVWVVDAPTPAALRAAMTALGDAPVIKASTLPAPDKLTTAGAYQRIACLELKYNKQEDNNWAWAKRTDSLVDIAKGQETLYVPLKNRAVERTPTDQMDTYAFTRLVDVARQLGIISTSTRVIGIRRHSIADITSDYVNFFDYLVEKVKDIDVNQAKQDLLQVWALSHTGIDLTGMRWLSAELGYAHAVSQLLREVEPSPNRQNIITPDQVNNFVTITKWLSLPKPSIDMDAIRDAAARPWESFISKYPLLRRVNFGYNKVCDPEVLAELVEYIKLVDSTI